MAITIDDFSKIWASTSPLTPYSFSESNYKEGWNFVGGTPPARQMWDSIQQLNDEKLQYLFNVEDGFLEKLITAFASDLDSLPAGTAFTATTALSKMIANMMAEDGVQYNLSNSGAWYIKLGAKYGGLIIQGGRATNVPLNGVGVRTQFPISFSSASSYNPFASADYDAKNSIVCAGIYDTTQVYISAYLNASSTATGTVNWLAIGI